MAPVILQIIFAAVKPHDHSLFAKHRLRRLQLRETFINTPHYILETVAVHKITLTAAYTLLPPSNQLLFFSHVPIFLHQKRLEDFFLLFPAINAYFQRLFSRG